ncbi:MAG TPA: hypothetical protein VHD32_15320 [Candidatus Didemnitutus sp.]|nr:hypothetical protein [Candidatus Didemnitutus sp.]
MKSCTRSRFRRNLFNLARDLMEACWSGLLMVEGSAATLARLQRPKRAHSLRAGRHTRVGLRRAAVVVPRAH